MMALLALVKLAKTLRIGDCTVSRNREDARPVEKASFGYLAPDRLWGEFRFQDHRGTNILRVQRGLTDSAASITVDGVAYHGEAVIQGKPKLFPPTLRVKITVTAAGLGTYRFTGRVKKVEQAS